ncbi:hypothetical protein, partial [Bacillus sp. SIMBA_005]|uniref:hypothetical protein n=1 Tax=Bacillus sp. SIMBA_005 TaxID=3085754 RepID=UPI00397CE210
GVGTITPKEKTDVRGAISFNGQAVIDKMGSGTIDYASFSPQTRIISWGADTSTNGIISFWTGAGGAGTSEKMRIHSNGNVG